MRFDVKFKESEQRFDVSFGEVQNISDGGYERGYEAGYADGTIALLDRTIVEYSNTNLTKLGAYALSGTQIKHLNLPSLREIEGYAFYECYELKEMVFQQLKDVPYNGLRQFKGIVKADFWVLESILSNGFYQCVDLEALIIRSDVVCTLAAGTVLSNSKIQLGTGYVYVPKNLVDSYKTATNWSTYASQIRAIEDYPEITGG